MAAPLEEIVRYRFKDPLLLKQAMTHKSFASESGMGDCNERLEFLGDSVLAAVVAHQLFEDYPDESEGSLSKKKSFLVSRPSLTVWAEEIGLGNHLYLGVGEETTGGRTRRSLLANALEALIGAMYLDGGFDAAAAFVREWCARRHGNLSETDHKSRLQEILQKKYKMPPTYELSSSAGPDHDKTFSVTVRIGARILGKGAGKSKKEAEQASARDALSRTQKVED